MGPDERRGGEVPIARNLFCSGHCFLADGRLVAGGQNMWQLSAGIIAGYVGGVGADRLRRDGRATGESVMPWQGSDERS